LNSRNQSPAQPIRQGRKPLLVYVFTGLLALLVGGAIGVWVRSNFNTASINKSEISNNASSSIEQNESLQEEQAKVEREKQKLADERKQLETKNRESISTPTGQAPRPSSGADWFVVLGSFPKNEYEKAKQRLQDIQGLGYDVSIIDTDNYPGLTGGLWAVVMGPYSKSKAKSLAAQMKSVRSDVYIRAGR
jgi:cell division septation protein DedD